MIVTLYFSAPTAQMLVNAATKHDLVNAVSNTVFRRVVSTACEKSDRRALNVDHTNGRIKLQMAKHHLKVQSFFFFFVS